MKEQELLDKLKEINKKHNRDPETTHYAADKLLVKALRDIGYERAMDYYELMEKWYA